MFQIVQITCEDGTLNDVTLSMGEQKKQTEKQTTVKLNFFPSACPALKGVVASNVIYEYVLMSLSSGYEYCVLLTSPLLKRSSSIVLW